VPVLFFFCLVIDISATVRLIGVRVCTMVELCPRASFSPFGSDIFWGHQMRGQERGSGEPFLASQIPIYAIDREYLVSIRA